MKSEWLQSIELNLNQQKEKIHKRDQRFFQVDQLLRIAERLDKFSVNCQECKDQKPVLHEISSKLADTINSGPSEKREFERKTDPVKKHLKKRHQIFPVYFFVSLYSFLGIASGVVIALLFSLVRPDLLYHGLVTFIIIGLIVGYFYGNKLDWKVRRENRLL